MALDNAGQVRFAMRTRVLKREFEFLLGPSDGWLAGKG
jgi:hypothetical protein